MIGKTISQYKIIEKIGEGGMGIVYKAEDTKLKRDVAIKFLPRQITSSDEERQRFKIEAQAAAGLNHPNIATIYNIEEVDDEIFIVMEYIEGRELREIIHEIPPELPLRKGGTSNLPPLKKGDRGGLPLDKVLAYATQIASGLQAAHEKDVTHRDIKSANIMVTDKDQIKIMDFGLAKVRGGALVTKVGTTLGTAAYMSPEQARGEEADHRSDLWAFGVVLYEMLTGKLPFAGDYEQAVLYSIMNEAPKPLTEHTPDVPSTLQEIIDRSLEKEKNDRYQSVGDLLRELEPTSSTATHTSARPAAKSGGKSRTGIFAAGAIGLTLLIALFIYLQISGDPKPIRLTNPQKITQAIGLENYPTWSPDGSRIAYASNQKGTLFSGWDIWMKQLSGGEPINMTKDRSQISFWPSWSPDGSRIAFISFQDGPSIFVMPAIGGPARRVGSSAVHSNPAWSADGSQLATVRRDSTGLPGAEIHTLATYQKREVAVPGEQFERDYLSWSPDGNYFAYADADNLYDLGADISAVKIIRIADGKDFQLQNNGHLDFFPIWSMDNRRLYFISDRGGTPDLWQVRMNADGSPDAEAEQISHGLGLYSLAFSPDQTKVAFSKEQKPQNLWRTPIPKPAAPPAKWPSAQQLTFESSIIGSFDLSRDGKQVYFVSDRSGNWDVWSMPATGGELGLLTTAPEEDDNIHLSPDGSTFAFVSERSGRREIWTMPAIGGPARQITNHPYPIFWPRWSPDGQTIAFNAGDSNSKLSLWTVPVQGGEARQITTVEVGNVWYPLWWPDGQSLVSVNRGNLLRFPVAGGDPEPLLALMPELRVAGDDLRWSSDKTQIYFIGEEDGVESLWSLSVADGAVRQLTDFSSRYGRLGRSLATDGTYLYFTWLEHTGDIWVMDVEGEE